MRKYLKFGLRSRQWGYVLAIASLLVIAIATLKPFNFTIPQDSSLQTIAGQFERTSHLRDYINNIILFMPWGYALAWIFPRKKLTHIGILILAVFSSLGLTLTVETTQYFLPERVSNLGDVTTNTIGGGLGACLYFWRDSIIKFVAAVISSNRHRLTPKTVGSIFIGYFVFIYLVVFGLLTNINISNWDDDFPLTVGNEVTGDRPWRGKISQLHISDRALSAAAINTVFERREAFWLRSGNSIASYLFSATTNDGRERNIANILNREPVLVWQHRSAADSHESPVSQSNTDSITLNRDRWLMSSSSASVITNKLRKTNQFTISAIVATDKIEQSDRARIVSISNSPFYRNLTIAQNQRDLIIRLRTPITDKNGSNPEMSIPNVFSDLQFHHLIITFDRDKISCYIDSSENKYSFDFAPEITFWSYFSIETSHWRLNLNNINKVLYQIGFYSIIFVPLGLLGGLLLSLFDRRKTTQFFWLGLVSLLPAFLLEQLYVSLASQPTRMFNLILGIGILLAIAVSSTILLFKNPAFKIE